MLLEAKGLAQDTPYQLVKVLRKYECKLFILLGTGRGCFNTWFSSGLLPLSALGWKGNMDETVPVCMICGWQRSWGLTYAVKRIGFLSR